MKTSPIIAAVLLIASAALACPTNCAAAGPFENGGFKGRIAWSADGNHNDPDDWIASPVALAIFAECGVKDRLVHFDYNCILPQTNAEWEKIHAESVLGAAERYGYDKQVFHDCRTHLDEALASITRAVNASTADDPLYFVIAGPMEVPFRALEKSDPEKRKFVYCISHSNWNDGFAPQYTFTHTKRNVITAGVHWVQIRDQNRLLSQGRYDTPAKPEEFNQYFWMRNSRDDKVRFLWERMLVSTRPDPSDAGMAWFLITGDEQADPAKFKRLLAEHVVPTPLAARKEIRLEAENFVTLDGYEPEFNNDRQISHRINVKPTGGAAASIRTRFDEPYTAAFGRYDVEIRYFEEPISHGKYALLVNGSAQGTWDAAGAAHGWTTHTIRGVEVRTGDEIAIEAREAPGRLDYVQLVDSSVARADSANSAAKPQAAGAPLDDADALRGQIIVAGTNPGHLKYNGGKPVFLCGPDNPEDFLYRGTLNADGTRSGGGQQEMIENMAKTGVNAFHCLIFRMQRCNFKKEGDDTHCPFVDHDPSKPLNDRLLNQWEEWLTALEARGINLHFEFYNDATDVEAMGWTLDANGDLHADERQFIAGIVKRFKHHKNILWGIEESCNKLPRSRTPHFKKIGALIAATDNHHHPIVQSFVVPNDPEGDFPKDGFTTEEYEGDPHIRVVTWLHVVPHKQDYVKQHEEYLSYQRRSAGSFVTLKNETFGHPRKGPTSRIYMWSCAMTGMHTLEAYHHADLDKTPIETFHDDGRIRAFMEQTDFHTMQPHDELAAGSTRWVLARPGESYIAYTYAYTGHMGLRNVSAGTYDLVWFDPTDGVSVKQEGVPIAAGNATWKKPDVIGNEVAVFIRRTSKDGVVR